jgi:lipopolysaccharide biosynthesis glycosyltransferase
MAASPLPRPQDPRIVVAGDDNYVMGMAVTLRSAIERLDPARRAFAYVLDGGISEASKEKLRRSLPEDRASLEFVSIDRSRLTKLPISHHANHCMYLRILSGEVLPPSIERVIYLDSDLLIVDDLGELWDEPLGDDWALAVPETSAPVMDATLTLPRWRRAAPYMASLFPVPNYRDFGIDPAAPYFNSGVLVLNLNAFRENGLAERMLRILDEHGRYAWCWDQYALNVALTGHWRPLPLRWNQGSIVYDTPDWTYSPFEAGPFDSLRHDPAIVHFTTGVKPWHATCRHPFRDRFFETLDRTAWAGWRPTPSFKQTRKFWFLQFCIKVERATRRIWAKAQKRTPIESAAESPSPEKAIVAASSQASLERR